MTVKEPFQLTIDDVVSAGLSHSDVGAWCVVIDNCYHLFESEAAAQNAHCMALKGRLVR